MANVSYAAIVEWMDKKQRAELDRTLAARPRPGRAPDRSTGTAALMAAIGRTQPRRKG